MAVPRHVRFVHKERHSVFGLAEECFVILQPETKKHKHEETSHFQHNTHNEMAAIRALDQKKRYFNMSYENQVRWFMQWNPED